LFFGITAQYRSQQKKHNKSTSGRHIHFLSSPESSLALQIPSTPRLLGFIKGVKKGGFTFPNFPYPDEGKTKVSSV